jgi:uncharacterized protein (TIGR00369 family)
MTWAEQGEGKQVTTTRDTRFQRRTRDYAWGDPAETVEAALGGLTGLELLLAIGAGELPLPPALRTLDIRPETAAPGEVVFTLQPREFHYNPQGIVHGGILVAMLDTSMGCAVHSHLPAYTGYVTLELSSEFLRTVDERTGPLRCVGSALPVLSGTTEAVARMEDAGGRVMATARSTCLIRPLLA